eukprot:COSAG01_NODE_6722_length_3527_cov_5.521004_5_plen_212_part_00
MARPADPTPHMCDCPRYCAAPAYRRFRRSAQLFDFTSEGTKQGSNVPTTQSALNTEIRSRFEGKDVCGNHVTPQVMYQLGMGTPNMGQPGMTQMPGMPYMQGAASGAGFAGAGGGGAYGAMAYRAHALDQHSEGVGQGPAHFYWPIRPNAVTHYRHIFYNPVSRKECREKNAQHGYPPEHADSHTPNNVRPVDCDEHMWQQALLNKPENPE